MSDKEPILKTDLDAAVSDLKLYFKQCADEERESLENMCLDNIKHGITDHLLDKNHFDRTTVDNIYEVVNNFKGRIKAKYAIGIPLALLFVERVLNKIGLF